MSDCKECGLRLETCSGFMNPFCANPDCSKYDKKSLKYCEKLLGVKNG